MPAAVTGVPGLTLKSGLGVPFQTVRFMPSGYTWNYQASGEQEELYGPDWAKLSLLEPKPRITFGDCVTTEVLPVSGGKEYQNYFRITGTGNSTNLPIYVKIVFLPRRRHIQVVADVDVPTPLGRKVSTDDLLVYDDTRSYDAAQLKAGIKGHFSFQTFEDATNIRWLKATDALGGETLQGKSLHVLYTEYYPAYQCSIDEYAWSQPIMLDPGRMFPDDAKDLIPLDLNGNKFPLTDEIGNPLGFWLEMTSLPPNEFLLLVENSRPRELTPGDFGANAVLEVEFDRPTYMNGIYVAPFVNFPVFVRSIRAEGMTPTTGETIFSGNIFLDRAQSIRFDRRLIRRLYIKLYQENYTVKEHLVDPADKNKRDAMATLQTVLPFSARRMDMTVPKTVSGFQYEIGLRDIAGEDWQPQIDRGKKNPGIFLTGPYQSDDMPEVLRFDAEYAGDVAFYLNYRKRLDDGTITDFTELPITPGTAISFTAADMAHVRTADFYLKFVLREEFSVVSKFLLQVSHTS
jgi:hypothetical protein